MSTPSRSKGLSYALRGVGLVLIAVILARTDLAALVAALRSVDPGWLALGLALPLPAILLRVSRWRQLLGAAAPGLSFGRLVTLYAQAIALGVVTPGRVGELAKAAPLTTHGVPLGAALASVIVDRLADLSLLAALATLAVVGWGWGGALGISWLLPVGVLVATSVGALLVARGEPGPLRRFLPDGMGRLPDLGGAGFVAVVGVTALSWAVTYGGNWALAQAVGIPLGYLEIAAISACCSLVASLPLSIAGVGTRDAALLVLLGGFGIARPEILALSALMLASALFVGAVCSLAFFARESE